MRGIALLPFRLEDGEVPQWIDALIEERDVLEAQLAHRGAECRKFWFPIHTQPPYRRSDDQFPHSTSLARKALWLPSALTLTDQDIATVCQWIAECLGSRAGCSEAAGAGAVLAAPPR